MGTRDIKPSGREKTFGQDEIIVSKTDINGKITYANKLFVELSGFSERELLGAPHSIVRHPEMPRAVFKLLWDTIATSTEVFAYVINMSKLGEHYWVFAHVTPSFGPDGNIVGYHSNRRCPDRSAISSIVPIYKTLLAEEQKHEDPRKGLLYSYELLLNVLEKNGTPYEEFVFSLT